MLNSSSPSSSSATSAPQARGIPLSIFLITRDEADRLPNTLTAIAGLCDDLIVVDSGSKDETCQIAQSFGARVFHNEWPGYGLQKRFAEEQCKHNWILNIDADEVIPPDLLDEIRALFINGEPSADAYEIRIAEIFPGEHAPHQFAYALAPVRLYRFDKGRYVTSSVHDRVQLMPEAKTARLRGTIHHYSVRSIGDQIAKLNKYTDFQVADIVKRGVNYPHWRVFFEFPVAFLKAYIGRRHFLRGKYGFITAMNYAFFRWLRMAKAIEHDLLNKNKGQR